MGKIEILHKKTLNQKWLKAAVIGSLWASFEIVVGSFLHNLKIPLSGTILSFTSVYILISFLRIWKENGLIWRAGLICAIMKSISPSAVILGPMIGILSEALILEFAVFILGKNLFSYIIAGALAVFSTLLHKLGSILILYGTDLIVIAKEMYNFTKKQFHFIDIQATYLIIFACIFYLLIGSLAGLLGYYSNKKSLKSTSETRKISLSTSGNSKYFQHSNLQKHSLVYLILIVILLIINLILINKTSPYVFLPATLAFAAFCLLKYKNSLRHLKKPSIWIQFVVITIFASFFWEGFKSGNYLTFNGLVIGLKMNLRAIVVIFSFAALSTELRNPVIKSLLYNAGFASLYMALNISFAALPEILAALAETKNKWKEKKNFVTELLFQAKYLLKSFEESYKNLSDIIIITGNIQEGKTTYINELISKLRAKSVNIQGITAPGKHNKTGERVGFNIKNIATGEEIEMCSTEVVNNWTAFGKYYFNPKAKYFGEQIFKNITESSDFQCVVIDEIGPIEIASKGWHQSIEKLCSNDKLLQIWVVRRKLVKKAARHWNVGNVYIADIKAVEIETLADFIENYFKNPKIQ